MFLSVKIFLLFFVIIFTGCACKPKIVEVPCKIPAVECIFEGMTDIETVSELIRCVYAHRKAAKVCQ